MITVAIDIGDNVTKAQNVGPVAVHALFCPVDDRDNIPRYDAVSQRKLLGEGTPSEWKVVLGWLIDTRTFHIYLPMEKTHDWLHSLRLIVTYGHTGEKNP